ncbi:hypothetical protein QFC20_005771 [Naganishia adeliensis]|uniref:Uncharacterized protein n=1 Tax=Naganishia adeliensis TaxID=92952 RepID=A0ACC2VJ43_9TREE|nr:hypothetical protein QFC20_005771 [Naganishia adeliensis]
MSSKSQPGGTQPSISAYFAKPASPLPKRKHSPTPQSASKATSSNANEPIEIDEFDDDDLSIQYLAEPVQKKARVSPSEGHGSQLVTPSVAAPLLGVPRTVESFFSRKATDKDGGRGKRALAIQQAIDARGSGAKKALQKYKLANDVIAAHPLPSGVAFDDYRVSATQPTTREVTMDKTDTNGIVEESVRNDEENESRRRRHAAWQKRLQGPSGLVPRRRSLNLDEAEAREARAALAEARGEEYQPEDENATPVDEKDDPAEIELISEAVKGSRAKKAGAAKAVKGRGKKKEEVGPSGLSYTPLEKQFMEIKAANPDVLLLVEVGYKYKFHGDDAKIASKELGIACFPLRNFYSASIPTHRLHIHVKKLVQLGYKVGVVRQTETAALKAIGDNRNKPFERKLTNLYTSATYVDDSSLLDVNGTVATAGATAQAATNAFVCLTESSAGGMGTDDRVNISILAVIASTGEVVYDDFIDSHLRTELETRLAHLEPTEILIPRDKLSRQTQKLVNSFAGVSRTSAHLKIRLETASFAESYSAARGTVVNFYTRDVPKERSSRALSIEDSDDEFELVQPRSQPEDLEAKKGSERVKMLEQLPKQLTIVLAAAIKHLDRFGLADAPLHIETFTQFSARAHMILSANCLESLEIFRNQTDYKEHGSLLWVLDQPLVQRLDAVKEILETPSVSIEKLKGLLKNQPDMQRGLSRIQYGKATPNEVATLLLAFKRIAAEFEHNVALPRSSLLSGIISSLPKIRKVVERLLSDIDVRQARSDSTENLFTNPEKFPSIQDAKDCMAATQHELDEHLKAVRKQVKQNGLEYITVAGVEHLIELRLKQTVPDDWVKMSSTKHVARYHTPFIISKAKELEQGKETLQAAATAAFLQFQQEIAAEYEGLRNVAVKLATFDCLLSFAIVAAGEGYSRPDFVTESSVAIKGGRHPMAEAFNEDTLFVPNDVSFDHAGQKVMIITGPNMAGKSTVVRATALICIMAQIGSYVPAESATLGLHDAIFTRMGASDELSKGQSTGRYGQSFMVELTETSKILREATRRSLVILDELGRGTSTHDGTAIAFGVLGKLSPSLEPGAIRMFMPLSTDRLANMGCNTSIPSRIQGICENYYMDFAEVEMKDGSKEIVFLYRLVSGLATRSFGVWVGKLAGIPQQVLDRAQQKGDGMRLQQVTKSVENMLAKSPTIDGGSPNPAEVVKLLVKAKAFLLQGQ